MSVGCTIIRFHKCCELDAHIFELNVGYEFAKKLDVLISA